MKEVSLTIYPKSGHIFIFHAVYSHIHQLWHGLMEWRKTPEMVSLMARVTKKYNQISLLDFAKWIDANRAVTSHENK